MARAGRLPENHPDERKARARLGKVEEVRPADERPATGTYRGRKMRKR